MIRAVETEFVVVVSVWSDIDRAVVVVTGVWSELS